MAKSQEITWKSAKNVTGALDGDILTIKVDLSKRLGPSKSGKTTGIATTSGNQGVIGGIKLGLNVYEQ